MRDEHSPARDALVRGIHAASVNPGEWPRALDQFRAGLRASVVTLAMHEFKSGIDTPLYESPEGLNFSRDMAAFAARNPWFLSRNDYTVGRVMTGDELVSAPDLQRSDLYRDFLRPRGLLHRLCGVVAQRTSGAYLLSAYRGAQHGAFGAEDKAALQGLLGHVTLSLECQWRWQEADDLARALLTLTDQDTHPTLLVTAASEAVYLNVAARRLFASRRGLRLEGGFVGAGSPADERVLREAIARVAQADPQAGAAAPRVVSLASPPPAPPLVVVIRAAGQVFASQTGTRRGLALITVRGGSVGHDPATCSFAHQYTLTVAQAKVGALVFAGHPLAAMARALNVSENTVRSHLKQIYQKTDTHGQMELVHLHARVCSALP